MSRMEVFCPAGSPTFTVATPGHYTIPETTPSKVCCKTCISGESKACGDTCVALSSTCNTVSGCACDFDDDLGIAGTAIDESQCLAGYVCEHGLRRECGAVTAYCPIRSTTPTTAPGGYFTVGGDPKTRQDIEICPAGSYCVGGEKKACDAGHFGNTTGLSISTCTGKCNKGIVCEAGSIAPDDSSMTCFAGYFCPSSTMPKEKQCGDANHYCPTASTERKTVSQGYYSSPLEVDAGLRQNQRKCEDGYACVKGVRLPCSTDSSLPGGIDNHYCKDGVAHVVDVGSYSTGGSAGLRTGQTVCEAGNWCEKGQRSPCAAGTYGETASLTTSACSGDCAAGNYGDRGGVTKRSCVGVCAAGFWCGAGSTKPREHACGKEHLYCPAGSEAPKPVEMKRYATPTGCTDQCSGSQTHGAGVFAVAGLSFNCPRLGDGSTLFSVLELRPAGQPVANIAWPTQSTSRATGTFAFKYSLNVASPDFQVNVDTGQVTTRKELLYDAVVTTVTVDITTVQTFAGKNDNGGKYTDSCPIRIQVVDRNQAPVLSDTAFTVSEDAVKGYVVGTLKATDTDTTRFTYQITKVSPGTMKDAVAFTNPNDGKLVLVDASLLDFEALASASPPFSVAVTVSVDDMHPTDPIVSKATVTLLVKDVADCILTPDSTNKNSLPTQGSVKTCFSGTGVASLAGLGDGKAEWAVTATYGGSTNTE